MSASIFWQNLPNLAGKATPAAEAASRQIVLVTVLGTALLLAISFLVVLAALFYRKRFWQLEQEKQLEIAKTQHELAEMAMTEIGRELHDELQNPILAVKVAIEFSRTTPEILTPELTQQMINDLVRVNDSLRRVAHRLSIDYLETRSLGQTAEEEATRLTRTGRFEVALKIADALPEVAKGKTLLLSRILQEMISNTLKHALDESNLMHIVQVGIGIEHTDGHLHLWVSDNGKGFDLAQLKNEGGFKGIRKKAKLLDARFQIESIPSVGTKVAVWLPVQP